MGEWTVTHSSVFFQRESDFNQNFVIPNVKTCSIFSIFRLSVVTKSEKISDIIMKYQNFEI